MAKDLVSKILYIQNDKNKTSKPMEFTHTLGQLTAGQEFGIDERGLVYKVLEVNTLGEEKQVIITKIGANPDKARAEWLDTMQVFIK